MRLTFAYAASLPGEWTNENLWLNEGETPSFPGDTA